MRKYVLLMIACLFLSRGAEASLTFKMSGGLSRVDGGDLNDSIRGWRNYYSDHDVSPYSFRYQLDELESLWESKLEIIFDLSSRLGLGVGLEFLTKKLSGEMSWDFSQTKNSTIPPNQSRETRITEESFQEPRYTVQVLPLVLTLYYSFPLGKQVTVSLGAGGGFYYGSLQYREDYTYSFDYVDTLTSDSLVVTDVDQYFESGEYTEKNTSITFGLHGGGTFELKLSRSFSFFTEVLARWVNFKGWKGSRVDSYVWEHTWGLFGTNYEFGEEEERNNGTLWRVDFEDDVTGNSYPRLIFSEDKPVSPSFTNFRKGEVRIDGISLRIGFLIRI